MENGQDYAFVFKSKIHPLALISAQNPLRSTIITSVFFKKGFYYVIIHANNDRVIDGYVKDCNLKGVEFEKVDVELNKCGAVYMFKE